MIILLIEAKVGAAHRDAFLKAARAQAEASRAEEGCIAFDVLEDPLAPGAIQFVELWRSSEDLTLHRDRPHSKHFRENGRTLAESLSARKFEATELV
jgi:quinol monooxygenase YgiN